MSSKRRLLAVCSTVDVVFYQLCFQALLGEKKVCSVLCRKETTVLSETRIYSDSDRRVDMHEHTCTPEYCGQENRNFTWKTSGAVSQRPPGWENSLQNPVRKKGPNAVSSSLKQGSFPPSSFCGRNKRVFIRRARNWVNGKLILRKTRTNLQSIKYEQLKQLYTWTKMSFTARNVLVCLHSLLRFGWNTSRIHRERCEMIPTCCFIHGWCLTSDILIQADSRKLT